MKIYMGPYPRSPITTFKWYQAYMHWAYPNTGTKWWDIHEDDYTWRDKVVTKTLNFIDDVVLWPVNKIIRGFRKDRKIKIRVDNYDLWSADVTLAEIIHPVLVKLKENKHGTPYTDRKDAPKDKKYNNDTSKNDFDRGYNEARWEFILDEMIFAFSMLKEGDWDFQIYKKNQNEWTDEAFEERERIQKRIQNGLRLFGKYYQSLWD